MQLRYPERLLQPWKDLRQFTQELYAMLRNGDGEDVSGGIDVDGPPRKRAEEPKSRQKRERTERNILPEPGRERRADEPAEGPPRFETPQRRAREPEVRRRTETVVEERARRAAESPRLPEPARPRRERAVEITQEERRSHEVPDTTPSFRERSAEGEEARRKIEPLKPEPRPQEPAKERKPIPIINVGTNPDYPLRQAPSGGGGGTNVFIGKVLSGSGDTYRVALYPDGPNAGAGDTVTVTIPVIDPEEKIDHDTWLYSIFEFTDEDGNPTHTCQPPVWMA